MRDHRRVFKRCPPICVPKECDKKGPTQCATGTGGAEEETPVKNNNQQNGGNTPGTATAGPGQTTGPGTSTTAPGTTAGPGGAGTTGPGTAA